MNLSSVLQPNESSALRPAIPWVIETVEDCRAYMAGNELKPTRECSMEETAELRNRIRRILDERFPLPSGQPRIGGEVPSSHFWSFLWDWIPEEFEDFPALRGALNRVKTVQLLFESVRVPAFVFGARELMDKRFTETDLYLMPDDASWLFVITHEEQFGPYFVPLT